MTIASTINDYLQVKGLSKKDVADSIEMPLSTFTTKIKNNTFTAEELVLIAQKLGLDLSSFAPQASGNMLITIQGKIKEVASVNKNISSGTCVFQIKNDEGDGIYIIGATPNGNSFDLLAIEDFHIRKELVFRIRSIEKINQFLYFGFEKVETEDIPVKKLMKSLLDKRHILTSVDFYITDMAKRFMQEIE